MERGFQKWLNTITKLLLTKLGLFLINTSTVAFWVIKFQLSFIDLSNATAFAEERCDLVY